MSATRPIRQAGLLRYDQRSWQATHVELRAVERSMPVALDVEAIWRSESFATFQAAQGTTGHVDPAALAIDPSRPEPATTAVVSWGLWNLAYAVREVSREPARAVSQRR